MISRKLKCLSPEGTTVNRQGRQPLGRDCPGFLQSRETATEATVAPLGLFNEKRHGFQGLTPLAINGRRFTAQVLSHRYTRPLMG